VLNNNVSLFIGKRFVGKVDKQFTENNRG
jgi:hypothetical protein